MGIILKIAKAELRGLFYSPIAWFLTVVFFVLCGIEFVNPIVAVSRMQDVMLNSDPSWQGFDDDAGLSFSMFNGVYMQVINNLYLFLPLLTMGVINRDVQSGSIKLLYSSPLRTREIVLGKYLGLMAFNLVLLACIALLLITGVFSIAHADISWFLSALLAIFLLSNTYAAIGLFISSVTNYQILAGILTFVTFFALRAVQWLWQDYDFFRDLTWFLSINNRAESMLNGLITTRDVAYFVLIIGMFLTFACIRLKSTQESKPWRVTFLRYAGTFLLVMAMGYLSSRPGYVGYLDVTARKQNTLHPNTQAVLKEMDGSPLKVTLYTNLLGKNLTAGLPKMRNTYVWQLWDHTRRFYPNLELDYRYYYHERPEDTAVMKQMNVKSVHELAEKMADFYDIRLSLFDGPEVLKNEIDLLAEDYGLVMQLEYKGKKAFLRTYSDSRVWHDENHLSGTIKRLVRDTTPVILFTSGHYERSPFKNGERDFGWHTRYIGGRDALINKGVDIDTVDLRQADIPDSIAILAVADPRAALDTVEQRKILSYIAQGRNAIFYAEPGKQAMLQPIMNELGITLDEGTLVQLNKHQSPNYLDGFITHKGHDLADEFFMNLYQATKRGPGIVFHFGAMNLSFQEKNGFSIDSVINVKGMAQNWIERGIFVADSAAPVYNIAEGDIKKDAYTTALRLVRTINGREQRIFVAGDADFMTSLRGNGATMGNAAYSWLLNNEYPVYHNTPKPKDKFLNTGRNSSKILWVAYVYVLPGLILATGIVILARRKRK